MKLDWYAEGYAAGKVDRVLGMKPGPWLAFRQNFLYWSLCKNNGILFAPRGFWTFIMAYRLGVEGK